MALLRQQLENEEESFGFNLEEDDGREENTQADEKEEEEEEEKPRQK